MNASAKSGNNGHEQPHGAGQHDVDPAMADTSQKTFSGFVRGSTYAAVAIALVLIGMALFLL